MKNTLYIGHVLTHKEYDKKII
ncbi:MAG: type II toxin-antitoxin system HigB family toxin [Cocleimonas sp.]|nr:type II toxin-antitoxin system HigB family toxin [Cocleimonas sp.]